MVGERRACWGWPGATYRSAPAYAIWTGIGAVGTAILGIALFGDPASLARGSSPSPSSWPGIVGWKRS